MATAEADDKVDIQGEVCPYTLIQVRDALKKMSSGQTLEVLCDYEPAAKATIPNFCEKKGYPLETMEERDNFWRLSIRKTD